MLIVCANVFIGCAVMFIVCADVLIGCAIVFIKCAFNEQFYSK